MMIVFSKEPLFWYALPWGAPIEIHSKLTNPYSNNKVSIQHLWNGSEAQQPIITTSKKHFGALVATATLDIKQQVSISYVYSNQCCPNTYSSYTEQSVSSRK